MKKTFLATIIAGTMALGITACEIKPTETTVVPTSDTTVETTEATPAETTEEESETEETFTPEEHAQVVCSGDLQATEFDFGDAVFETYEWEGTVYPDSPNYEAGKDIVISFKCHSDLTIDHIAKVVEGGDVRQMDNPDSDEAVRIDLDVSFEQADGVYTLTIPSDLVTSNNFYDIPHETPPCRGG